MGKTQQDQSAAADDDDDDDADTAGAFLTAAQRAERRMLSSERKKVLSKAIELCSDDEGEEYDDDGRLISALGDEAQRAADEHFVEFSDVGLVVYFSHAVQGQLRHHLIAASGSTTYLFDQLLTYIKHGLRHDSLVVKELALLLLNAVLKLLPSASLSVDGENAASLEDELGQTVTNEPKSSKKGETLNCVTKRFQFLFNTAQDVVNVMATCPSAEHRSIAAEVMRVLLSKFQEGVRMKLLAGLIELAPYPSVTTLLLLQLKDEIVAEYKHIQAHMKKLGITSQDTPTPPSDSQIRAAIESFSSDVVCGKTVAFILGALKHWAGRLKSVGEPFVTGLNVLRTLVFSDLQLIRLYAAPNSSTRRLPGFTFNWSVTATTSTGPLDFKVAAPAAKVMERLRAQSKGTSESHISDEDEKGATSDGDANATLYLFAEEVLAIEPLTKSLDAAEGKAEPQRSATGKEMVLESASSVAGIPSGAGESMTMMLRFSIEMAAEGIRGYLL